MDQLIHKLFVLVGLLIGAAILVYADGWCLLPGERRVRPGPSGRCSQFCHGLRRCSFQPSFNVFQSRDIFNIFLKSDPPALLAFGIQDPMHQRAHIPSTLFEGEVEAQSTENDTSSARVRLEACDDGDGGGLTGDPSLINGHKFKLDGWDEECRKHTRICFQINAPGPVVTNVGINIVMM